MYTIFFADDEQYVTEGLGIMVDWQELGIDVIGNAFDGQTAYDKIVSLKPDIVITDICMPGITGIELIEKCGRNMKKPPKFVVLSGYGEMEYVKKAMKYGARDYLLKPIDGGEVQRAMENVLGEIANERQTERDTDELMGYLIENVFTKIILGEQSDMLTNAAKAVFGDIDAEFTLIVFKISNALALDDIDSSLEKLKAAKTSETAISIYIGMRTIAVVLKGKNPDDIRAVADTGRNFCNGIFKSVSHGVYGLYDAYKKIIRNTSGIENGIVDADAEQAQTAFDFEIDTDRIIKLALKGNVDEANAEIKSTLEEMREKRAADVVVRGFTASLILSMSKYSDKDDISLTSIYDIAFDEVCRFMDYDEAYLICTDVLEHFLQSAANPNKLEDMATAREIVDYINENYNQQITLSSISKKMHIKPVSVSKMVSGTVGMKFSNYLNFIRIKHAKQIIMDTNKKITQIASEVGYSDYYYFSSKFKSIAGVTPSEFKRSAQKRRKKRGSEEGKGHNV